MSAWRRKAIGAFPNLRREFEDKDATVYTVFFELLARCREAHSRNDAEELRRIYEYADWSFRQGHDLQNAAAVAFHEHLADEPPMKDEFREWVEPDILEDVSPLLEWRRGRGSMAHNRDGGKSI